MTALNLTLDAVTRLAPEPGLVVFDVDLTLGCEHAGTFAFRPGVVEFADTLLRAGYRLVFWTAGPLRHVLDVADASGLRPRLAGCHRKPEYPIREEEALRLLGERAALTVDDDATEAVPGWPFLHVLPWWGPTGGPPPADPV